MDMTIRFGVVYWITGLSAAGKSTLARHLRQALTARGRNAILVDGDAVRTLLPGRSAYDRAARLEIALFNGRLCLFLAEQGLDVVCATISLFHECQAWNRANIPTYREIYLKVPLEELARRDTKNLYQGATNVVGVDIPAEEPLNPDFLFDHADGLSAAEMTAILLNQPMVTA
ncbi:MAG: adenylyl-sulfate kinase [Rhodospirillales bacterium]|nr:adenylyl-sulfate kinase [Rhodospirillales bacterium]